jgi:hypothetical protein
MGRFSRVIPSRRSPRSAALCWMGVRMDGWSDRSRAARRVFGEGSDRAHRAGREAIADARLRGNRLRFPHVDSRHRQFLPQVSGVDRANPPNGVELTRDILAQPLALRDQLVSGSSCSPTGSPRPSACSKASKASKEAVGASSSRCLGGLRTFGLDEGDGLHCFHLQFSALRPRVAEKGHADAMPAQPAPWSLRIILVLWPGLCGWRDAFCCRDWHRGDSAHPCQCRWEGCKRRFRRVTPR